MGHAHPRAAAPRPAREGPAGQQALLLRLLRDGRGLGARSRQRLPLLGLRQPGPAPFGAGGTRRAGPPRLHRRHQGRGGPPRAAAGRAGRGGCGRAPRPPRRHPLLLLPRSGWPADPGPLRAHALAPDDPVTAASLLDGRAWQGQTSPIAPWQARRRDAPTHLLEVETMSDDTRYPPYPDVPGMPAATPPPRPAFTPTPAQPAPSRPAAPASRPKAAKKAKARKPRKARKTSARKPAKRAKKTRKAARRTGAKRTRKSARSARKTRRGGARKSRKMSARKSRKK